MDTESIHDPGEYFKDANVADKYDGYIGKNIPHYWRTIRCICDALRGVYGDSLSKMTAVEFGAGTGNLALTLASQLHLKRLLMLDHSASMLAAALRKAKRMEIPEDRVQAVEASILNYDWNRVSGFEHPDIVLFHLSLDHVEHDSDLCQLLQDIYDRLSPGGCLVIAEKCADGSDKNSLSWKSFLNMVQIRQSHMLENGFMSESETESWRQHLLCDDILRPLGVLRQLIEKTGFRIYDAWGIALGADKPITYEAFYQVMELKRVNLSEPLDPREAFAVGILIGVKS